MKNTQKGFTLIELLVVVSIIGMLSSIVLASLRDARSSATKAAGLQFSSSLLHTIGAYALGYWNFNEPDTDGGAGVSAAAPQDYSGNNLNFSSAVNRTSNIPTKSGFAASSPSIIRTLTASEWSSIRPSLDGYTFAAWIYPTAVSSGSNVSPVVVLDYSPTGTNRPAIYFGLSSTQKVVCGDAYLDWATGISSVEAVSMNAWAHIACAYNGKYSLYINGKAASVTGDQAATSFAGNNGQANLESRNKEN